MPGTNRAEEGVTNQSAEYGETAGIKWGKDHITTFLLQYKSKPVLLIISSR